MLVLVNGRDGQITLPHEHCPALPDLRNPNASEVIRCDRTPFDVIERIAPSLAGCGDAFEVWGWLTLLKHA
jgi:hypothetical protein